MDMADRHKVSMITCVEGLPTQGSRIQNGLKTHFVTDSDAMFERLLHLDAEPVPTAMIEGPTGGILARAPYHSTNGMSTTMLLPLMHRSALIVRPNALLLLLLLLLVVLALMAEVDSLDPGAKVSVSLVRMVQELLGFSVELAPMEAKAHELEGKVRELVDRELATRDNSSFMYS
jgi:predicted ATP-grasp superfamily ATP-dependent carboligase